jgi:DNA (cytosine-5)-methyltransferase 1
MSPPRAYYNEIDRDAAHILRCLIADGLIMPGDVDDRSIKEVQPDDLRGYTQCHFFAGGGLWSVAARTAGWPDARPLWTGSCPCQPFSGAGKGLGTDDPRHLWPDLHRLVRACRPPVVMGEQVAQKAGYDWFDGVRADLAGEGYASRGVDIPACAIDAPHQRNRLYWIAVGDAIGSGLEGKRGHGDERRGSGAHRPASSADGAGAAIALANGESIERGAGLREDGTKQDRAIAANGNGRDRLSPDAAFSELQGQSPARHEPDAGEDEGVHARPNGRFWSGAEWIICHDGKARRTQPGLRFLVDGMVGRIPAWRLAGNSISPVLAAEVIAAFLYVDREAAE